MYYLMLLELSSQLAVLDDSDEIQDKNNQMTPCDISFHIKLIDDC